MSFVLSVIQKQLMLEYLVLVIGSGKLVYKLDTPCQFV